MIRQVHLAWLSFSGLAPRSCRIRPVVEHRDCEFWARSAVHSRSCRTGRIWDTTSGSAALVSGLLYWLMDGGGPLARSKQTAPVDFASTQHLNPGLAAPNWRPVFLDYLHLGFTNATAFSPTDVLPLTHRAKYTMLVQSTVALALVGLVVARAVNALK